MKNTAVKTIVLAENHPLTRQALRKLLEREPGLCVVGEAADGEEALRLVLEKAPDVLVTDLMMPRMTGVDVVKALNNLCPEVRVIVVSNYTESPYLNLAFEHGVSGFIDKAHVGEDLLKGVRAVFAGERFLSPSLTGSDT